MFELLYSLLEFLVILAVLFLRLRFPGWLDGMPLRLVPGACFIYAAETCRFMMLQECEGQEVESLWLLPFGLLFSLLWLVGGVLALVRRSTCYRTFTLICWLIILFYMNIYC